ncbi:MAG: hypothetical protein K0S70_4917 [Microbacterium sp.]|nr:hypothetical protein [Microbacterium sp.]
MSTGSVSETSAAPGSSQSRRGNPPAGSNRQFSANTATSRMPTQKTGIAPPSCDTAEKAVPYQVRAFHAAMNPTGTAISTDRTNAMSVRGSVTFSRRRISSPTGRLFVNDRPRSKLASWPR